MGGALARPAENGGALSKLDAQFAIYSVGIRMSAEIGEVLHSYLEKLGETMKPWAADGGYYNFVESSRDVDAILPPDVCDRLRDVKRRYDPENRIVANHMVSLEV
jgi:hypothetical protein